MKEIVEEHKQSYDENNMRDFIDVYLKEMKEGEAPEFTGINTEFLVAKLLFNSFKSTNKKT